MFSLLVKTRLIGARNAAMDSAGRHPVLACGLTVLGIVIFTGMSVGFRFIFEVARDIHMLNEAVYQIFFFLFLFLLAGSVPFVASTLFQSGDYGLLFASPVPPKAVVAAKLLDATVTNSLQFAMLGIPAIVACVAALSIPAWAWLLTPVLVAAFVLMPALATALALLVTLAVLGMRRVRAVIATINAVMAAVVCITMVIEAGRLPISAGISAAASAASMQPSMAAASPAAHSTPTAWFAAVLIGVAQHGAASAGIAAVKIILLLTALYAGCLALGGRLLSAASVAEDKDVSGAVATPPAMGGVLRRSWPLARVSGAVLRKDVRYLQRDSLLVSQLVMPMLLSVVPIIMMLQHPMLHDTEMYLPFGVFMVGVILFMQTSILSLTILGMENRAFWTILAAPVHPRKMLWAKFLLSSGISCGVGWALSIICAVMFRMNPGVAVIQLAVVATFSAGLCGLGIGISAAFPRFVYDNPAHRVSAWALILGFFASLCYLFLNGVLVGITWWITNVIEGVNVVVLWASAGLLFVIITGAIVVVFIEIGARRIERYQWEY